MESLISIFSLVTSFVLAYRVFYQERASISIIQDHGAERSSSFSFDGWSYINSKRSQKYPDQFYGNQFRLISEIIITNNSSLPISIISFTLNDIFFYDSYVDGGKYYLVTTSETTKIHIGSPDSPNSFLKPNFTINPYTSVRGDIFFNFSSLQQFFEMDIHDLKVQTSRGTFNFKLNVPNHLESIRPLDPFSKEDFFS